MNVTEDTLTLESKWKSTRVRRAMAMSDASGKRDRTVRELRTLLKEARHDIQALCEMARSRDRFAQQLADALHTALQEDE